jgi:hypothetical protein
MYAYAAYNRPMKRISFFITIPQYQALKRLSQKLGMGIAELIRRAVDDFLKKADK